LSGASARRLPKLGGGGAHELAAAVGAALYSLASETFPLSTYTLHKRFPFFSSNSSSSFASFLFTPRFPNLCSFFCFLSFPLDLPPFTSFSFSCVSFSCSPLTRHPPSNIIGLYQLCLIVRLSES